MDDELIDRIDNAIELALLRHEPVANDSRCSCGAKNNMDGDVLHAHRLGIITAAVHEAIGSLSREQRTLEDGWGGVLTDYKTGKTTHSGKPSTIQQRWVTEWETAKSPLLPPLSLG